MFEFIWFWGWLFCFTIEMSDVLMYYNDIVFWSYTVPI